MASKTTSKGAPTTGAPIFVTDDDGPGYRARRPPVFPAAEAEPANLYFHVGPTADASDVEAFEAIANVTATAVTGEAIRVRVGMGDEVPRLELMPTVEDCLHCQQPMPERTRKVASVGDGASFTANTPGRYRLRVTDSLGRFAFLRVGVVPREMLEHPFLAVVRSGPDRGAQRTPRERRAIARGFVREHGTSEVLETLTAARPLPPGFSLAGYGG